MCVCVHICICKNICIVLKFQSCKHEETCFFFISFVWLKSSTGLTKEKSSIWILSLQKEKHIDTFVCCFPNNENVSTRKNDNGIPGGIVKFCVSVCVTCLETTLWLVKGYTIIHRRTTNVGAKLGWFKSLELLANDYSIAVGFWFLPFVTKWFF